MRSLAVIACALVAGCSLDRDGTGALAQTFDATADTAMPGEDDTGSIFEPDETSVADAPEPDTAMPDTAEAIDTAVADTEPAETVAITTRALGVTVRTFDLTLEGSRDWAHWGHTMTDSFNRREGVTAIAKGTVSGASTFESGVLRFSWTNGEPPNKTVTESPRGLTMSSGGEYVSFDVQGDPTKELTLDVWASGTSDATITGALSGSTKSAATNLGAGVYIVTFAFRTAAPATKLHVELKKGSGIGSFNLFAASLR